MGILKSLLKTGLDSVSTPTSGKSLPNALKKKGVTDDELKFADLDIDPNKKYTPEEASKLNSTRKDTFGEVEPDYPQFKWVGLPAGKQNPTYKERVFTFKQGEEAIQGNSSHFDVDNYLMHTRSYEDTIKGSKTKVVQEIQSDLHQSGRSLDLTPEEKQIVLSKGEGFEQILLSKGVDDRDPSTFVDEMITKDSKPESPYEKSWLSKGIERELMSTIEEGSSQMAIPISGKDVDQLGRTAGVQSWYETTVLNTARKIAKTQGAAFSIVEDKGVKYAVIEAKSTKGFNLYTAPSAAVGATYLAMRDGGDYTGELETQGFEPDDIAEITAEADKVKAAVEAGYTFDEAMNFIHNKEPQVTGSADQEDSTVMDWVQEKYSQLGDAVADIKNEAAYHRLMTGQSKTPESLLADLQLVQPNMTAISGRIAGAMGNDVAFSKSRALEKVTAKAIIELASSRGIELQWEPNDNPNALEQMVGAGQFTHLGQPLNADFFDSISNESGELVGAIAGAVAGAKRSPFKNPVGTFLSSIAGAVTGAVVGTEIDYLKKSIELQENLSATIALQKATTAAEASVLGDLVAYPIAKTAGALVELAKLVKESGPSGRGAAFAKEYLFLSDSEAQDLVIRLKHASIEPEGSKVIKTARDFDGTLVSKEVGSKFNADQEKIRSMALSEMGGEDFVSAAGKLDPQVTRNVAMSVDKRAKDLTKSIENLSDANVGKILVEDLGNYVAATKQQYKSVVEAAANSPKIGNFQFDFEKLSIQPALNSLYDDIQDPAILEKFVRQHEVISKYTDKRSLADLVALRQVVNDVRFNTRALKGKSVGVFRGIIDNIDGLIEVGAKKTMPKEWLGQFSKAKSQYAKMKGLEKNTLAKAMRRDGADQDMIAKSLTKYITATDGTYQEVLSQLPKRARGLAEGAVMRTLATKFTAGKSNAPQAINFPALSDELEKITFTMPDARAAKAAIKDMSEVFKNDWALGQASAGIQLQPFQSMLTADPATRAKLAVASTMFNSARQFYAKDVALIKNTVKVLKDPLHAKSFDEFVQAVDGDVNLTQQMMKVRQEAARKAADGKESANVVMYGDGKNLSAKGSGTKQLIAAHRIAPHSKVKQIMDIYGVLEGKALDSILAKEGFIAVQTGSDSVRKLK